MYLEKVTEYLAKYKNTPRVYEDDYFKLAICEIVLGNYPKAKDLFVEFLRLCLEIVLFGGHPRNPIGWLISLFCLADLIFIRQ